MAPLLQGTQINIRVTFMLQVFDSIPVTVYQAKMQYNAVHRHTEILIVSLIILLSNRASRIRSLNSTEE